MKKVIVGKSKGLADAEQCDIHVVVGSTVTETKTRLLASTEFHCSKCNTIHTRSAYAIAQRSMNVDLIFTCDCGNKINV